LIIWLLVDYKDEDEGGRKAKDSYSSRATHSTQWILLQLEGRTKGSGYPRETANGTVTKGMICCKVQTPTSHHMCILVLHYRNEL